MRSHLLLRLVQVSILCAAVSATAFAQYGGGTGGTGSGTSSSTYTAPSGGYGTGKAVGIGVGVAVAVVAIALYVHHRHKAAGEHSSLVDPTQSAHNRFSVTHERNPQTSSPIAKHTDPEVGEQAELTGQGAKDGAGGSTSRGRDLVKDYGTVSLAAALSAQSGSR